MGEATHCLISLVHEAANQSCITSNSRTAVSARSLYSSEPPWGLKMSSSLNANEIKKTPGSDMLGKRDRKMEISTETKNFFSALRNEGPLKAPVKCPPGEWGEAKAALMTKHRANFIMKKVWKMGWRPCERAQLSLCTWDMPCLACPAEALMTEKLQWPLGICSKSKQKEFFPQ